jgi:phospholipase C
MTTDRRSFLQLLSAGALAAAFPPSISRALEIPANHRTGSIRDVEHIVILMQENRSFDHYFGSLRGVRGFGDPRVARLASGASVWYQPNGVEFLLPFHPGAPNLGLQFLEDLAHDWETTHAAWNGVRNDQWVPQKGPTTMAHLVRSDIPYHYALADAFTVCDAYHCSLLGPTDPNRYHMWTGWVGNDGKNGGPVIDNAEAGYDWSTFPEVLQKAGVSWKIYQDIGEGLDAAHSWGWTGDDAYIGNYGDNSLLYFHQYQNAPAGSPLANGAKTGTNIAKSGTLFDQFAGDVKAGKLPQVSWIVAPEAYTEHPNWPANYGAWYVSQMLEILTSNPDVWSKTALFLTYDENDGFFDHVVPPTPPQTRAQGISNVSIKNEIYPGDPNNVAGPYGLGMRVPMVVISPWSKGGWVNSEVFDHTSLIQFIEKRFGVHEPNITEWRRAVTGDLTSAFDFKSPNEVNVALPSTVSYQPPDDQRHPDYVPTPPVKQAMPRQEPGTRPARAVPYRLSTHLHTRLKQGEVVLDLHNAGQAAGVFHVRSANGVAGPWSYTVAGGTQVSDTFAFILDGLTAYDLAVFAPNGFYREYKGSFVAGSAELAVRTVYFADAQVIAVEVENRGQKQAQVRVTEAYSGKTRTEHVDAGGAVVMEFAVGDSFGWYDLAVEAAFDPNFYQRFAGHLESEDDSISDPAIAAK